MSASPFVAKKSVSPAVATLDDLLDRHDREFVISAYQALLGRYPDKQGLANNLARLRSGISKREILAQLRLSPEGVAVGSNLTGMNKVLRRYKWVKYPVLGWLIRRLGIVESNRFADRKLRAVELKLDALNQSILQNQSQIDSAINALRTQLDQMQQAMASMEVRSASPVGHSTASIVKTSILAEPIVADATSAEEVIHQLQSKIMNSREAQQLSRRA